MFDKKRRRFEAVLLAAVTVLASFSVNWSSLSPKASEETSTEADANADTSAGEAISPAETTEDASTTQNSQADGSSNASDSTSASDVNSSNNTSSSSENSPGPSTGISATSGVEQAGSENPSGSSISSGEETADSSASTNSGAAQAQNTSGAAGSSEGNLSNLENEDENGSGAFKLKRKKLKKVIRRASSNHSGSIGSGYATRGISSGTSIVQVISGTNESGYVKTSDATMYLEMTPDASISYTANVYLNTSDPNTLGTAIGSTSGTFTNTQDASTTSTDNTGSGDSQTDTDTSVTTTETDNTPQSVAVSIGTPANVYLASGETAIYQIEITSVTGSASIEYLSSASDSIYSTSYIRTGSAYSTLGQQVMNIFHETADDDASGNYNINLPANTISLINGQSTKVDSSVTVNSTGASSNRAVTYTSDSSLITINGNTITASGSGSGTATVTASAKGAKEKTFTVNVLSVSENTSSVTYDGNSHTSDVSVTLNGNNVTTSFNVTYSGTTKAGVSVSNQTEVTEAGTYNATLTGTGEYAYYSVLSVDSSATVQGSWTSSNTFTINQATITDSDFENANVTINSDTSTVTAVSGASHKGKSLVLGTDFNASVSSRILGSTYNTYSVTFNGIVNYSGNATKTVNVTGDGFDISTVNLVLSKSSDTYTGQNLAPTYSFTQNGNQITFPEGAVTVTYKDASGNPIDEIVNAGKYTIIATGNAPYSGSTSADFTVKQYQITNKNLSYKISANGKSYSNSDTNKRFIATGSDIKPVLSSVSILSTTLSLTEDTDFKLKYDSSLSDVGTHSIKLTGQGNYKGAATISYQIVGNLKNYSILIGDDDSVEMANASNSWKSGYSEDYDGSAKDPSFTLFDGDDNEVDSDSYTYTFSNNVNASENAKVTITGQNDLEGQTISATFTINPLTLPSKALTIINDTFTYNASDIELTRDDVEVDYYTNPLKINKKVLTFGTDYELSYSSDHKNAGTVSVTATGKGNYTGTTDAETFKIEPLKITDNDDINIIFTDITDQADTPSFEYTGSAITPAVKLTYKKGDETINLGTADYKATYSNNTNVGKSAKVTVTGQNNLTGTKTKNFSITEKSLEGLTYTIGGVTVEGKADQESYVTDYSATYTGKTIEPAITIMDGNKKLTSSDFGYTFDRNINANTATENTEDSSPVAKIKGKGNYSGNEIDLYFSIEPKDINSDTITPKLSDINSDTLKPTFTLSDSEAGANLKESTDFDITRYDSTKSDASVPGAAGDYTAVFTGKGNYTGTRNFEYTIGQSLADADVEIYGDNEKENDAGTFEYLAGNLPYVSVSLDGGSTYLTGPVYENGSFVNDNTTSDYIVSVTPEDMNEGDTLKVTVSVNEKSSSAKKYFGSTSKIAHVDAGFTVTKRDISKVQDQLTFTDANAKSGSGTSGDPFIYVCDGTDAVTPDISMTYAPVFTPKNDKLNAGTLSTKSETVSAAVTRVDNVTATSIDISKAGKKGQMTVTGSGNYESSATVYYEVQTAKADDVKAGAVSDITYDGNVHQDIDPVVTLGDTTLVKDTDYTIKYTDTDKNYTDVGTYNYQIVGTGTIFNGTIDGTFKIVPANLSTIGAAVSTISNQTYTGSSIELTATKDAVSLPSGNLFNVTANGNILTPIVGNTAPTASVPRTGDYWFTYSRETSAAGNDHTNPGRVILTIHGNGNYTGTVTGSFYITADLSDSSLFTVNGITDNETLTLSSDGTLKDASGKTFTYPDSISITYQDKVNGGTATLPSSYYSVAVTSGGSMYTSGDKTVTITGIPSYATNKVEKKIKVVGNANTAEVSLLSTTDVTVSAKQADGSYIIDYTGSQPQPTVLVTFGGKRLTEGTDYTVSNGIPRDVGYGTITVTGNGTTYSSDSIVVPVYVKYNLSKANVTFGTDTYSYTGAQIIPSDEMVTIGSKLLSRTTDYQISYRNNTNPGTAYATVTPDANGTNSTGSATGTFKITPVTLNDDMVTVDTTTSSDFSGTYNGKEQKPGVTVIVNGQTLKQDTDYTVKYSNNVNAGDEKSTSKPTVTVKGIGGYTGTITKYFTISPKDISELTDSDIVIEKAHFAGEGIAVEPAITVKDGSTTLKKGTDYNYSSSDFAKNTTVSLNGSTASVTIHGYGNYIGERKADFTIDPLDLSSDSQIKLEKAEAEYTGNEVTPTVQVTVDNGSTNPVLDSKYYDVKVDSGDAIKDAGTYTCTVSANSTYEDFITGSKSFTFTINPKEINFLDDNWNTTTDSDDDTEDKYELYYQDEEGSWQKLDKDSYPSFTYDYAKGKEVPAIYLIDTSDDVGGKAAISDGSISTYGVKLTKDKDITITYSNNTFAASATGDNAPTITISGTGNYSGSIVRTYSIGKDITNGISVKLSQKTFYYNGEEQKPTVESVHYNGKNLTEGTDYTVTFPSTSVKAGEYSVQITGTGEYYGTYDAKYTIKGKKLAASQIGIEFTDPIIKEKDGEYYVYYDEDVDKFEPAVAVYDKSDKTNTDGIKLDEGTDYTVTYGDDSHDNKSSGTDGIVHITLTGDYSGTAAKTFAIKKIDISDFALTFTDGIEGNDTDGYTAEYTGSAVSGDFYIQGSAPDDTTIYTIDSTEDDAKAKISYGFTGDSYPGIKEFTITGIGDYTGTITKDITITGNIENATVSVGEAKYTGAEVDPPVTVSFYGKTLTEGTDYELSYAPSSDYASGTVTVTGKGYFTGSVTSDYTLTASGDIFTMTLPNTKYPYTGNVIKPVPTITNSATGTTVTNATITYSSSSDGSDCILPGTVTVTSEVPLLDTTVTLTGQYSIVQASIYDCTITGLDSYYDYTGSVIKPLTKNNISVTLDGMTIPTDCYDIQYPDKGYILPGAYTVSVVGKGVIGGHQDLHYQIRVPKVENLTASAVSKNSATLAWDGVGVASGYRITYTQDGKGKIIKTTKNSVTLTGLPESANITVGVSAYLKNGTKLYYSVVTPVSVGTKLTTPAITNIQAGVGKNTLSWNKVQSSGGYMIYRCTTKNGSYYPLASVPANRAYFTDTRAKSGRTYYYKVSTYRITADGTKYDESEKSAAVGVTTR